ncbi:protein kinase, partial [Singulisphaera rosea]
MTHEDIASDPSAATTGATRVQGRGFLGPNPRPVLSDGDASTSNLSFPGSESLDPALFDIVEEYTRRLLSGEDVDLDALLAEHPEWAETLKGLLPTMQGLADFGQLEADPLPIPNRRGESLGEWYFGNFRVIREVGRGGMGIVYEAEQVELKRRVALKILPLAAAMDSRALQRFQLEAQVAGWLQHPRIVPVHAVGVVDELPFYAMQLVEGGSLA